MELQTIDTPAAYMVHDLGPRRFHEAPAGMRRWASTALGVRILERMARHGLDARDAHPVKIGDQVRLSTDAGALGLEDLTLDAHAEELDSLFASVASGIAQERMARLAGWRPGDELPLWAVTASDVLVRRLRENGSNAVLLWNAAVNIDEDGSIDRPGLLLEGNWYRGRDPRAALPADCHVARYGTGMHFQWYDEDGLHYKEGPEGATLTLPTRVLQTDLLSDILGGPLGNVLHADYELADALADYVVIGAAAIAPEPSCTIPQSHLTKLHLAVPMRTLEEIPEKVLLRGGVDVPVGMERDRPLWMLTASETLLRYRPRRG